MIAYVIFPFVINAIVTNKFYLGWWFVESSLSSSEWFAFFASYIGNIGTILFGWIAYWQTELINRQSEQAQAQQIQINDLKQIVVQYQV